MTCSSCDFLHLFMIIVFRPQASSRSTKAHHNSRYCSTKFWPAPKKSTDWDCESKSAYSEFRMPAGQARPSYLVVVYDRSEYQGVWGAVAAIAGESVEIQVSVGKASWGLCYWMNSGWTSTVDMVRWAAHWRRCAFRQRRNQRTRSEPQRLTWSVGRGPKDGYTTN